MSRKTITLTAPNGATVRTVLSKRYFVVGFGQRTTKYVDGAWVTLNTPEQAASVIRRTDSAIAALAALRKHGRAVVFAVSADGTFKNQLPVNEVEVRANTEKQNKNFVARTVGTQGEARRLWY